MDPRAQGDAQHLVHRLEDAGTFISHMYGEQGVMFPEHPGQGRKFLFPAVGAGGIDEPQGHSKGPRLQFPGQEVLHGLQFLRGGIPVVKPHHRRPQSAVPHQQAVVGGAAVGLHRLLVVLQVVQAGELQISHRQLQLAEKVLLIGSQALRGIGQDGGAAVAHNLSGYPLIEFALRLVVHQGAGIRVAVDVDKAGGHRKAGGVQHPSGLAGRNGLLGNAGNPAILNAEAGPVWLSSGPVHNQSILNDEVIH